MNIKNPFAAVLVAAAFLIPAGAGAEKTHPDLESQFVLLDLDSDGRITLGEWTGGRETFGSLDRNGDDLLVRSEFFHREVRYQTREERFRELDADGDAKVSAEEWKWGSETLAALDRDGDGVLTRAEFFCQARGPRAARGGRTGK